MMEKEATFRLASKFFEDVALDDGIEEQALKIAGMMASCLINEGKQGS